MVPAHVVRSPDDALFGLVVRQLLHLPPSAKGFGPKSTQEWLEDVNLYALINNIYIYYINYCNCFIIIIITFQLRDFGLTLRSSASKLCMRTERRSCDHRVRCEAASVGQLEPLHKRLTKDSAGGAAQRGARLLRSETSKRSQDGFGISKVNISNIS